MNSYALHNLTALILSLSKYGAALALRQAQGEGSTILGQEQ